MQTKARKTGKQTGRHRRVAQNKDRSQAEDNLADTQTDMRQRITPYSLLQVPVPGPEGCSKFHRIILNCLAFSCSLLSKGFSII